MEYPRPTSWIAGARRSPGDGSAAATSAAERVLDERPQIVDQLGGTHQPDRGHRLAQRHVLEQARPRHCAVAWGIDHVKLLVVGGEVAGLARRVEGPVALPRA